METRSFRIILCVFIWASIYCTDARAHYDTLYSENFDNGAPGWQFLDLWGESFWHASTTGAFSGSSYWCADEELGGYDDLWAQTLTSPAINLTGTSYPWLTFMHSFRGEEFSGQFLNFDAYDAFTVRVSTDGENYSVISPAQGMAYNAENAYGFYFRFGTGQAGWWGNSGGWILSGFDLSAYAGQTVWIQFLFGSDYGLSSLESPALTGWHIDDIQVKDGPDILFSDDAGDTGEARMKAAGAGGCNLWHLADDEFVSPPYSVGCFDPASGNYKSCIKSGMISPPIAIGSLPEYARELVIDFNVKGLMDLYQYHDYLSDVLAIDVRAYRDGKWGYWTDEYFDPILTETFHSYNDYEFFPVDINNMMDDDSIQVRIILVTSPDDLVMEPARIYIDDFRVIVKAGYCGEIFGQFYDRIFTAPYLQRQAIADSFLATLPYCPIVEDNSTVTFLYKGDVKMVTIPGLEDWDTTLTRMSKILGTDLWFYQTNMEPDSRIEYKFVINGVSYLRDPLNPDHTGDEFDNSQLVMPEYVPPEEIEYHPDIPHGAVFDTIFYSTILDNSRKVYIYMPPGYDESDKYYPIILFHDGGSYYSDGLATNVLDNLIADQRICPVIAVFVPPVQRELEYAFDLTQEFESFIVEELLPYIESEYRIRTDPGCRAMAGSSFGGLISAQICYDRPEEFGLCATYSPAFWPLNFTVFFNIISGPGKNIKFYVDWGTHERLLDVAIIFKNNLLYNSYEVTWNEWHDGHNLGNWRAHLDNMLEYFFPLSMGTNDDTPRPNRDLTCYPNPVSHTARIEYQLDAPEHVKIAVYNQIGEQVAIIANDYQEKGKHYLDWDAEGLASSMYYLRVYTESTGKSKQAKVVVIR